MNKLISRVTNLTAASILVMTLVSCGGAEERKAKYLEKGKTYLAEKNYDKAKIEVKNVLQIDPKSSEAYYLMGQLEEKKSELMKAVSNYRKAIDLDPVYTDAKIKLAKIYVIAGTEEANKEADRLLGEINSEKPGITEAELVRATLDYKSGSKSKAVKSLEEIVNREDASAEAAVLLANIYIKNEEYDKAKVLLVKSAERYTNDIPVRVRLAELVSNEYKDLDAGEKYLKEALAIEPDDFKLTVALARFYGRANKLELAEDVLRKSIERNEDDVKRYLMLVELLSSRKGITSAEAELKKAIEAKPDLHDLKFALVSYYEKIGQKVKGKQVLSDIIKDRAFSVESVRAKIILANYLMQEGDKPQATAYVDEVLAEYPNNNDALLLKSKISLSNMDAITAINGLRAVVKNNPKNAEASLLLAQAYELNGESGLSEAELKKAIENNPINDKTHANYSSYLISKGRKDEAKDIVDKALTYFKSSYDLLQLKLKLVLPTRNTSEINSTLDEMEQLKPDDDEVNIVRGQIYVSKKDFGSALEQFEVAYKKAESKLQSLELITRLHIHQKEPAKAIARLNARLEEKPGDSIANFLLGQVEVSKGNLEGARQYFKSAIDKKSDWLLPHTSMASTYIAENNFNDAINVYKTALTVVKDKVKARMQLAGLYERTKDFSEAMQVYRDILSESPGNFLASNNLASLLLDNGDSSDIPQALELSKKFEKMKQPALLDTLGWAYAKSGDNAKAIEILKPIVDKAPEVAVFRYHLGYALYQIGDKSAAKSHLEIAVSSKQGFAGKEDARKLLQTI